MTTSSDGPELTVVHRIRSGSNAVYRCVDQHDESWVYKPSAGERPLMDFPDGSLAAREVAAYTVSASLGWDLVPETVTAHGPGGKGMAQRWVDERQPSDSGTPDPVDVHPVDAVPKGRAVVLRGEGARGEEVVVAHDTDQRLRRIALFDHVINNADSKGGHVLVDQSGRTWAIDHGLSFHSEPKVRTVLWGWAGQPLDGGEVEGLSALARQLSDEADLRADLGLLLSSHEIAALADRLEALLADGRFPVPGPGYPLPWPLF